MTLALLLGLAGHGGAALADDEPLPDMALLEYLGSWEESDEDWLVIAADAIEQVAADEDITDPADDRKEAVETDDES